MLGSLGGIAAGLTILLVHPLVARVAGRVRAVAAQLVVVALVATSPWMAVPYTDLLAMPLLTGAVLLVLRAAHRRDWLGLVQLLASAALAAGAIVLKTTPTVLVVAVAVVGLLLAIDLRATRRDALVALGGTAVWVAVTLALVASLSASATAALGSTANDQMRTDATPPTLWWVANGMTPTKSPGNPTRYGGYNGVMLRAISAMDTEEATAWSREWIRTQRGEPGRAVTWRSSTPTRRRGTGATACSGRGARERTPSPTSSSRRTASVGSCTPSTASTAAGTPCAADLAQGLWVALLLVTGSAPCGPARRAATCCSSASPCSGSPAFTLVFQGRSRYLLTFVPLVVALAAMVRQRPVRAARPVRPGRAGQPVAGDPGQHRRERCEGTRRRGRRVAGALGREQPGADRRLGRAVAVGVERGERVDRAVRDVEPHGEQARVEGGPSGGGGSPAGAPRRHPRRS